MKEKSVKEKKKKKTNIFPNKISTHHINFLHLQLWAFFIFTFIVI